MFDVIEGEKLTAMDELKLVRPDLHEYLTHLGFTLEYEERTNSLWVRDETGDVDLTFELFLAITASPEGTTFN